MYAARGFKFSDVYFGGGTPTVMMDELLSFLDFLKQNFNIRQISLETTPREVDKAALEELKKSGVNRLSIGVQSFDNDLIHAMGRMVGTGEEAVEKLK
ncbi:MAG TPA: radical SAM protein, partial [Dehalococcoidales bacterium]|nr:radical SAM protein [Dehalococcoidales bacterium]